MKRVIICLPVLLLLFPFHVVHAQQILNKNFAFIKPGDTKDEIIRKAANIIPTPEQYNWQKREFTAFIHFGMNTFTNKEWGEGDEDEKLFNPTELNAEQWIKALKEAGVKMAILTAKHHDGFCLWPSKYTKHSVKSSPWKNGRGDVVREFVNACRKYGMKAGLYLSPWDRNNPDYGNSPKYNEYYRNQLRELLTNYGEIDEVWFDGANGEGPNGKKQVYDWTSYYSLIRKLQPKAVIFGMSPDLRWVGTESGYGRDTEWSVVPIDLSKLTEKIIRNNPFPLDKIYNPHDMVDKDLGSREKLYTANGIFWYPAEVDVSIRPGWFYHPVEDTAVKSVAKLVDIYFNSVGKNGVLLLNVPPDKRGLINDVDIKSLKGFRQVIDNTFSNNLAEEAKIKTGENSKSVNFKSFFSRVRLPKAARNQDSVIIEFNLPKEKTFDVAMLQEDILIGQRIEKFHIDYWNGNEWARLTEGSTVGYKRLLRFQPVTTNRVRLVIEESRLTPLLSNFGLFKLNM